MLNYRKRNITIITILLLVFGICSIVFADNSNVAEHVDREFDEYRQAPELKEMVDKGEIPPVRQRLPENPVVVKPLNQIGEYGGTAHSLWQDWGEWEIVLQHIDFTQLVRRKADLSDEIHPDLAESWEVSEDNTEFTFHLREGLKWSDGHPVTTEDVMFYYEDVLKNEELVELVPEILLTEDGDLAEVEAIDKNTFKVTFPTPNGMFLFYLSMDTGVDFLGYPKHYFKNYHPEYVSQEELNALMEETEVDDWVMLFEQKDENYQSPEKPTTGPWKTAEPATEAGTWTFERNPYFYKVDTEGAQLPYLDKIVYNMAKDKSVLMMQIINGEVDFVATFLRSMQWPLLVQQQEIGNYRAVPTRGSKAGEFSLFFNMLTSDSILRDIFQDIRFRRAASIAVDREEINEVQFQGLGMPKQVSWPTWSILYDPEWTEYYAEYNPEKANQLLDDMGLTERDSEGYRVLSDGERFRINMDYYQGRQEEDAMELLKKYFSEIGIEMRLRPATWGLYIERSSRESVHVVRWSTMFSEHAPQEALPIESYRPYAVGWRDWMRTDGEQGVEPPEDYKQMHKLVNKVPTAATFEQGIEYLEKAGEIYKENLWVIGYNGEEIRPSVAHNRLKNYRVGENAAPSLTEFLTPGATGYPEQFYIDED